MSERVGLITVTVVDKLPVLVPVADKVIVSVAVGGITDAVAVIVDVVAVPVSVGDEVTVSVAVGGITDTVTLPVLCDPYDSDADGLLDVPYVSVNVTL